MTLDSILLALLAMPFMGIIGLGQVIGALKMTKPKVPAITPIDTTKEQEKALKGNISNMGLINQLSELATKTSMNQMDAFLGKGTRDQITSLIQSGLKGELPQDVVNLIRRRGAEISGGQGLAGSQLARNLTLRDLGLTSLQRTDMAMEAANRWLATSTSSVPQFNFQSMFVTPAQTITQANINQENVFQRDWLSNQINAAFTTQSRWAAGLMAADAEIAQIAASLAGSAGGMM